VVITTTEEDAMGGVHGRTGAAMVFAVALFLVAASCGGNEQPTGGGGGQGGSEEEGGTITVAGEEATDHGTEDVAGMSSVELEMDDSYFEPTVLSGEAGQSLTVELTNEGGNQHTFTVDSLDVDVSLAAGDTGEAEVTFPDSGALLFYCQFHDDLGMRGALSVGGDLQAATTGGGGGGGGGSGGGGGGSGSGGGGYGDYGG
jgi:plastocyanin